jgi:hypothetical protein
MRRGLFNSACHALLMMTAIPVVSSTILYQLEVRQVYAPTGALDAIEASALSFLHEIFNYAPSLQALGPGEICPDCAGDYDDDDAIADDYSYRRHDRSLLRKADAPPMVEQDERRTQINTCPSACQNSGRKKCRILGCAYCGSSCARRRSLQSGGVTPTQAKAIEAAINRKLKPYCDGILNCKIKALLFRQNPDGTITQVRYEIV